MHEGNNKLIDCKKCERLVLFREKIAKNKRKQFSSEKYWAKPVPGFGDICANLMIIGLAPAAHGANRTGRVFTGDKSSEFLFSCLYKAKISNQPFSKHKGDGLILKNTYLTLALKCVPPNDKPLSFELNNCYNYLSEEFKTISQIKVILTLGKVAFDVCLNYYYKEFHIKKSNYAFYHGSRYLLPDGKVLVGSYHPSPRNVNTGRIDEKMMVGLLNEINNYIMSKSNKYFL